MTDSGVDDRSRPRWLALALLACCAASACEQAGGRSRRLARDGETLRASIRRLEASGLQNQLRASVAGLLADVDQRTLFDLGDWGLSDVELRFFARWNAALAEDQEARRRTPLAIITGYAQALAERGIDLIVVPVPTRIDVYPERLPEVETTDGFAGASLASMRFLLDLAEAGVETVDLAAAFAPLRHDASGATDPLLYLAYDGHWTPRGTAVAADAIAARIRELEGFELGPAREGVDFELRRERASWQVHKERTAEEQPPPADVWFERVVDDAGSPAHEKDRASPILLIGDSFVKQYRPQANDLASLLYVRLGQRIDVVGQTAPGGVEVWRTLQRRGDELAGKRIVVWVFRSRVLGTDRFESVELFADEQ